MNCPNCGATAASGSKFCEVCGAKLPEAAAPAPEPYVNPTPGYSQQPGYTPPQQPYQAAAQPQQNAYTPSGAVPPQNAPLSPWAYFGLSLLFSIPVVGFVLLIVYSFNNDNINRRNYARSFWCALLVVAILFVILAVTGVFSGLADQIWYYLD